jgi:hypothetical protein
MTKEAFVEVYLNRFPKEIKQWFKHENDKIYSTAIRINNVRLFEENGVKYINLFSGFLHDGKYKPFLDYSLEIQTRANFFLNYIKEVLCSNNEEAYEYMKIITAGYCKGMKWDIALYLKTSAQGVGKSTFYEMISEHILGLKCCLKSGSEPLVSLNNSCLQNKSLVMFEELESFSADQWSKVGSKLKDWISSKRIMIRDLYIKSYESDNTYNYIIASNNPCIKDSSGRRYYILEINTAKKYDFKYWAYMRDEVFNNEVGECLFNYFLDIKIPKGFNAQHNMPANNEKADQIAKTLHSSYVFLKERYIRTKDEIIKPMRLSAFYDSYKEYCQQNGLKCVDKFDLVKRLSEVGISKENKNIYKSSNIEVIKFTQAQIKLISDREKWVHDFDDIEEEEEKEILHSLDVAIVEPKEDYKQENIILKKQLDQAKEEIEQLKRMVAQMQNKPKEEDVFSDDEPKIAMIAKPKLQVKKVVVKKKIEDSRFIIEGDSDIFDMICNKF